MPNIELHGYGQEIAEMLRGQIFDELFADKSYADDMVVTIVSSEVTDRFSHPMPFIRLLDSDPEEAEEILQILQEKLPGEDIEYLEIKRFIPGK